ncbi:MAG: hypothetical protein PVS2B2_03130 [Candidatus Acidiferrum sp.]
MKHGLGDDHEAVGQDVFLDVASFGGERRHNKIVTQREDGSKEMGTILVNDSNAIFTGSRNRRVARR